MRYRVEVTETINHTYYIDAADRDEARDKYQNMSASELKELDQDGESVWDSHPWEIEEEEDDQPAPLQIADASSAGASPRLEASTTASPRSASNPCIGGEFEGWAVFCHDGTSPSAEVGFNDEASAERFAEQFRAADNNHEATVCVVMRDARDAWEGEEVTVYTGCMECDHEQEFKGWKDYYDHAHFPCPACGQIFDISNFPEFFDDEPQSYGTPVTAHVVRGARCLIRWTRQRSADDEGLAVEREESDRYISLGEYVAETNADTYGIPDDEIFYYATPKEFYDLMHPNAKHPDGWEIVSYELVAVES